jgi:hypothetical protein
MQRRSLLRWWPLLVVALASACTDETTPSNPTGTAGTSGTGGAAGTGGTGGATGGSGGTTGGTGGSAPKDGGMTDTGGQPDVTVPPGDGGLSPCALDLPNVLDRPPSGRLPCDLLPPGFVSP